MGQRDLDEKIARLEGRIDELSNQVKELQKDSHPMHFMPCQYKEPKNFPTRPPDYPRRPDDYPPGYGPMGPIVTC